MKAMTCKTAQVQLLDSLEGELDDARRAALQDHLATCQPCRRELQELERLRGVLGHERVPDPGTAFWEKFPDQVWQAYQSELATATRPSLAARARKLLARMRLVRGLRIWIPAAAALSLAVGLGLFFALETARAPGIAEFQARIQGGNLAPLAQRGVIELPADHRYGFAPAGRVNFFRVGHGYAESLAYAAGGDAETARLRLALIAESLGTAPDDLAGLARGSPSLRQIAALEPNLERIATSAGAREVVLFRAGGWLVNLALAVAARDRAALRDAAPEILTLRRNLKAGGVAPGALGNLDTLTELLTVDTLSDRDYADAARLIRDAQLILM